MHTQYTTSMCTILHYPNIDLIWHILGTHFGVIWVPGAHTLRSPWQDKALETEADGRDEGHPWNIEWQIGANVDEIAWHNMQYPPEN